MLKPRDNVPTRTNVRTLDPTAKAGSYRTRVWLMRHKIGGSMMNMIDVLLYLAGMATLAEGFLGGSTGSLYRPWTKATSPTSEYGFRGGGGALSAIRANRAAAAGGTRMAVAERSEGGKVVGFDNESWKKVQIDSVCSSRLPVESARG